MMIISAGDAVIRGKECAFFLVGGMLWVLSEGRESARLFWVERSVFWRVVRKCFGGGEFGIDN